MPGLACHVEVRYKLRDVRGEAVSAKAILDQLTSNNPQTGIAWSRSKELPIQPTADYRFVNEPGRDSKNISATHKLRINNKRLLF